MKLTGKLKNQVEKAETREAAREAIAKAGMLLTDDKLDQVSGGYVGGGSSRVQGQPYYCEDCQKGFTVTAVVYSGESGRKEPCPYCQKTNTHAVANSRKTVF